MRGHTWRVYGLQPGGHSHCAGVLLTSEDWSSHLSEWSVNEFPLVGTQPLDLIKGLFVCDFLNRGMLILLRPSPTIVRPTN